MKVVTNRCYGGFGLSNLAQEEYLKLIGKEAFFYKQTKYKHESGVSEYSKVTSDEESMFCYTVTKDLGNVCTEESIFKGDNYFCDGDLKRDDPNLVKVVENLGEKSSGRCAKLEITEIPDGIDYTIDEYDGFESVHEQHQSW